MNAKLIGAICVGEIRLAVFNDKDIRAAVEGICAVLLERVFGILLSVNLDDHSRARLLGQLKNKEERGGDE